MLWMSVERGDGQCNALPPEMRDFSISQLRIGIVEKELLYANELSNVVNIPGLRWKSWNSRKDTCRIGTHENQNLGLEDFLDDEHLFRLWGKPGVCCVHLYGMCLIPLYPCI